MKTHVLQQQDSSRLIAEEEDMSVFNKETCLVMKEESMSYGGQEELSLEDTFRQPYEHQTCDSKKQMFGSSRQVGVCFEGHLLRSATDKDFPCKYIGSGCEIRNRWKKNYLKPAAKSME